MEKKKEINVKLNDEVKYDYNGDKKVAEFVTLKKPTARQVHLTSILKNAFQNAAMAASKNATAEERDKQKKDDESELTAEDAVQLLYIAPEGIDKCMLTFKELLRDVALFDGEIKATVPLIDELSVDDFEEMLGKYLINFIIASLLEKTKSD